MFADRACRNIGPCARVKRFQFALCWGSEGVQNPIESSLSLLPSIGGVKMNELATSADRRLSYEFIVHELQVCMQRCFIGPLFRTGADRLVPPALTVTFLLERYSANSVKDTTFTLLFTVTVMVNVPAWAGKV